MVEEFIGIIAATIIVMRPCFHLLFTSASSHASGFFSTRKSATLSSYGGGVESGPDRNSKGFRQIVRTTEIEMETRNRTVGDEVGGMPVERGFARRVQM